MMRAKFKGHILKKHNVKLEFMSAFARASVLAVKEIPAANASIEGDSIVYRDYVDLNVAVATPKGLVTPILRDGEAMGFLGMRGTRQEGTIEDLAGGSPSAFVLPVGTCVWCWSGWSLQQTGWVAQWESASHVMGLSRI